jgi:hypothetical protein
MLCIFYETVSTAEVFSVIPEVFFAGREVFFASREVFFAGSEESEKVFSMSFKTVHCV